MKGPFLRIQLDESELDKIFRMFDERIDKQEEMIQELQKQLKDRPSKQDVDVLIQNMNANFEAKSQQLASRVSDLEAEMQSKISSIENSIEERIKSSNNAFELTVQHRIEEVETKLPKTDLQLPQMIDRLQSLEDTVHSNGQKLHITRESVQTIASSIALLNNTTANLDNTLSGTLNASVSSVGTNFSSIQNDIHNLKAQIQTLRLIEQTSSFVSHPSEPTSPLSVPQTSAPLVQISQANNSRPPMQLTPEPQPCKSDVDITKITPYPSLIAHWKDSPELPRIQHFNNIGEVVDYIYRLIPKLQAYLLAMHDKIVEDAADMTTKIDKPLVEKMFEKFQNVIGEVVGRVDQLKEGVESTASREEINKMVGEILTNMYTQGQTAVGRVKCIACGRDIPQVSGATTEEESSKALGNPPNSFAFGTKPGPSLQYSNKEGFDSNIIESPRSIRPVKPIAVPQKARKSPR